MQTFELSILDWFQDTVRCGLLDAVVPVFTRLCDHGELWIVLAAVLLLYRRTRRHGGAVACGLVLDLAVCNILLKPVVARIRPYAVNTAVELLVPALADYSFPSGHTAASFAATAALWASGSRLWKPALAVAVLMGLSRLYLYVHWPSDVLAGVLIGWLCGVLGAKLSTWLARTVRERRH